MSFNNLFAFSFPVQIFLFWGTVGYAVLTLLRTQRNVLQNVLLAPSVGFALNLFAVYFLSRLGFPVKNFALPLLITLFCLSSIVFVWQKPTLPMKKYLLFGAIFLLGLVLTGSPLLEYGLNWISYANDDMANYCLGAMRLLNHGYGDIPTSVELLNGTDRSLFFWFLHVGFMSRVGSEWILAFISSVSHLNALQAFMPTILALHLCLISSTGAFLYHSKQWKKAALITCLLLACSSLMSIGVLYQLIAQIGGLALLVTAATLLLQPFKSYRENQKWQQAGLISFIICALLLYYPELFPFLTLSFILYNFIILAKGQRPTRAFWLILGITIVLCLVALNTYLLNIINYLISAVFAGLVQNKLASLFPYYLIPSGIANLWGLQILSIIPEEPWLSISIVLGIGLTFASILMFFSQIRKAYPAAVIASLMTLFALDLFISRSGFALFKLIMYMQPFLISVLVIGMLTFFKKQSSQEACVLLFVAIGLVGQSYYVMFSKGNLGAPFSELSNATKFHLNDELFNLTKNMPDSSLIMADTPNIVSGKIMALYTFNHPTTFYTYEPHRDPLHYTIPPIELTLLPERAEILKNLMAKLADAFVPVDFNLHDPKRPDLKNSFIQREYNTVENTYLISSSPIREIFNRRKYSPRVNFSYEICPIKNVRDHLIFISSNLGMHYYLGDIDNIAINNIEKDLVFNNESMAGIGRYFLFKIINPSPKVRLEVNLTTTFNGDGINKLPTGFVIGSERKSLPLMGRGSARVFSPVINPQIILNKPYLMIDFGSKGKRYPTLHKGIMSLYGNDIQLDIRYIVGSGRDISLISEEDYQNLSPPSAISHFPTDLANKDLEYSGIFEDGWISEDAFFNLTQPPKLSELVIKGMVPIIVDKNFAPVLTLLVDGKRIYNKAIHPGDFIIRLNVPNTQSRRKIEMHFSQAQHLPNGDNRPVSAKLNFLGFDSANL